MKKANEAIRKYIDTDPLQTYIDTVTPMVGNPEKEPAKDLFIKDGLHLSPKGYRLWNKALRDALNLPAPK